MKKLTKEEIELVSDLTLHKLNSNEFVIGTPSIFKLENDIMMWIRSGDCGGIVVGRTRAGKTSACNYIKRSMKLRYGKDFPVFKWELTEHYPTDKAFYSGLITIMGITDMKKRATGLELRERVIRYMGTLAMDTKWKKIVLMIDEAHKLSPSEYDWLMDLYNVLLSRYNVLLTVILVGTKEILAVRKSLITGDRNQIVERFMLNIHRFEGVRSLSELQICMSELDKVYVEGLGEKVLLGEFFFPEAYEKDSTNFSSIAHLFWEGFKSIQSQYNKSEPSIPMEYLLKSFIKYLLFYGISSYAPDNFFTKAHVLESIKKTHFQTTSDRASEIDEK